MACSQCLQHSMSTCVSPNPCPRRFSVFGEPHAGVLPPPATYRMATASASAQSPLPNVAYGLSDGRRWTRVGRCDMEWKFLLSVDPQSTTCGETISSHVPRSRLDWEASCVASPSLGLSKKQKYSNSNASIYIDSEDWNLGSAPIPHFTNNEPLQYVVGFASYPLRFARPSLVSGTQMSWRLLTKT